MTRSKRSFCKCNAPIIHYGPGRAQDLCASVGRMVHDVPSVAGSVQGYKAFLDFSHMVPFLS